MKHKQKGFALPISLLLLVVMTLMGATLVGITTGEVRDNEYCVFGSKYIGDGNLTLVAVDPSEEVVIPTGRISVLAKS